MYRSSSISEGKRNEAGSKPEKCNTAFERIIPTAFDVKSTLPQLCSADRPQPEHHQTKSSPVGNATKDNNKKEPVVDSSPTTDWTNLYRAAIVGTKRSQLDPGLPFQDRSSVLGANYLKICAICPQNGTAALNERW